MKNLELLVTSLSLTGATLISFDQPIGFLFFLLGNISGIYLFLKTGLKGIALTQVIFGLTAINGLYRNYML